MWDVLSGDFDQTLDPQACANNVISKTNPGSIIVFHDSLKAQKNMKFALSRTLGHFTSLGYSFSSLNEALAPQRSLQIAWLRRSQERRESYTCFLHFASILVYK